MAKVFDLSSVRFVKRIVIGQQDVALPYTQEQAKQDMQMLNQCLSSLSKGHIIACEKNFCVLNQGEHQVVQQWVVYHIGFEKKPLWIDNQ